MAAATTTTRQNGSGVDVNARLASYMASSLKLAQGLARMKQPALSRDMIRIASEISKLID